VDFMKVFSGDNVPIILSSDEFDKVHEMMVSGEVGTFVGYFGDKCILRGSMIREVVTSSEESRELVTKFNEALDKEDPEEEKKEWEK